MRNQSDLLRNSKELVLLKILKMNNFVLLTSGKVLPTFQTFCLVGVHFAQTLVHFAHFQCQARKRGILGWGWGCFVYVHIPERGLRRLSKE